jgi:excisionase family DNA binding protein
MKAAEELLPVAEIAALWRCSKNYVYDLIASGALTPTFLPSGRAKTRVRRSVLDAFVGTNTDTARKPKEKTQ